MTTEDKVKEIVASHLGRAICELSADKKLEADLYADSLDLVEIIMSVEEEFGVFIDDGLAENIKTVGDLTACVEAELRKGGAA